MPKVPLTRLALFFFIFSCWRTAEAQAPARTPSIAQVIEWLRDLPEHDAEEVRDLRTRVRRGGWLPLLRVGARQGLGQDYSAGATTAQRYSTGQNYGFDISLTFHFDRAVVAANELGFIRETRARQEARQRYVHEVIEIYFERERLLSNGESASAVRVEQLTALLDYYTEGRFSRALVRRRLRQ